MKVLFDYDIFHNFRYGGISRYITELYVALIAEQGVQPQLCAPFCDNEYIDALKQNYPILGDCVLFSQLPKGKRALRELIYRGVCLKLQPDILHGTYFRRHQATFPAKHFVITLHDMTNELLPEYFPKNDPMPDLKRKAVEAADHVICISEQTRIDAMKFYNEPEEKFSVVHHGAIKLPEASLLPTNVNGKPYILFVGQRAGYKNFSALLDAYILSKHLQEDFLLICCGGGEFSHKELNTIRNSKLEGRILQFSGDDALLAALYKHAAAMVYPSLYEGFGMPLLEAFSLSCPVITSNCGAIPEVAQNAVKYIDVLSPEGILDSIQSIVYNQEEANLIKERGLLRLNNFTWSRCAKETVVAYQKAKQF